MVFACLRVSFICLGGENHVCFSSWGVVLVGGLRRVKVFFWGGGAAGGERGFLWRRGWGGGRGVRGIGLCAVAFLNLCRSLRSAGWNRVLESYKETVVHSPEIFGA